MTLLKLKFIISYILVALITFFVVITLPLNTSIKIIIVILISILISILTMSPTIKLFTNFQKLLTKVTSGYLKLRLDLTSIDVFENVSKSLDRTINGFVTLIDISKQLSREMNLDKLLNIIIDETTKLMDAKRATLFLYNKDTQELWSYIAQELEIKEIRLPLGKGIAGHVAEFRKMVNIKNAYKDKWFDSSFDKITGFVTKNILAAPMLNHKGELLGVLEVVNKKTGDFDEYDESLLTALSSHVGIAIENTELYESQENLFRSFIRTIAAVIDARDPVTKGHSERVARYSIALAKALNFTDEQLKLVEYAAILHDVGKISIPDAVLLKPGSFTTEEYDIIKKHAIYTKEILSNIYSHSDLKDMPLLAASHHEKLDGSGYPQGLKKDDIPLSARIIAVADIYDALVSYDRPYKPAIPPEKAIEILLKDAEKGKMDKEIIKIFIDKKLYQTEKREYIRISADFSMEYRVLGQQDLKTVLPTIIKTKDISASDLLFESKKLLPVGSYLETQLHIPQLTVNVIAKVARQIKTEDSYQIGITFINLSSEAKNRLSPYLSNLSE